MDTNTKKITVKEILIDKYSDFKNRYWYKKNKKYDYEVGVIAVVHTFGRDLKWNPHVHALVTEGAVNKNNN